VASKAFVIGIVLNLVYVVAETIGGLATGSLALLTDAGHNLSDVASLALSLLAFRLARLKPTAVFTYGYKKSTILAALINAVLLLIAIGVIGYEAIIRLLHPEPVQGGTIAWIAGIGIIINAASALLFFRHKDHELNARGAYLHLMADALVSLGVVVAGICISLTGWFWLDPVVSLIVAGVILYSTWSLLTGSLRLSMDAVPAAVQPEEVKATITGVPGVKSLHHLHIWAMSTTENALTAHVVIQPGLDTDACARLLRHIKHQLAHLDIQHATIELEWGKSGCPDAGCETARQGK
jgi:cobalt-zinc-cadmium efflux system protein